MFSVKKLVWMVLHLPSGIRFLAKVEVEEIEPEDDVPF
jgi:hypothetical protein